MTRTKLFWLAASVFTLAAMGAGAQDVQIPAAPVAPGTAGEPAKADDGAATVDQLDSNKDGQITKAEAQGDQALARRFSELDRDNSGKLDRGEFARFEIGDQTSPGDARSRGGLTSGTDSDASESGREGRSR
jgi:hypothetical protein